MVLVVSNDDVPVIRPRGNRLGNVGRLGVNMRAHDFVVEQLAEPDGSVAVRPLGAEFGGDPAFDLQVFRERDSEAA
ncbi:hypothetical protein E3T41_15720 [Cryobacterium sp. Hh38]|nr:hypothetical protein E3T41_15720 [Cryobacterium sp. Hh38]